MLSIHCQRCCLIRATFLKKHWFCDMQTHTHTNCDTHTQAHIHTVVRENLWRNWFSKLIVNSIFWSSTFVLVFLGPAPQFTICEYDFIFESYRTLLSHSAYALPVWQPKNLSEYLRKTISGIPIICMCHVCLYLCWSNCASVRTPRVLSTSTVSWALSLHWLSDSGVTSGKSTASRGWAQSICISELNQ